MKAVQIPNRRAYFSAPVHEARRAEDPHPHPGARADHEREDRLALHVAPERALDPLCQRQAAVRREAPVDRRLEPRHVEEHVDRDHDHEDDREEEDDHRERRSPREGDRVLGVAGDVARPDRLGEVVELLLDPDPLEAVVVEPLLEPVDVDLDPGLARRRALLRQVRVDPVGRGACLRDDDGAERDEQCDEERGEDDRHDGDGDATWEPQARQVADEGVEGERDHRGGEEQEQDVPERPREEEREQEDDRKADELDPPRDPDRRGARARVRRAAEAILILGRASGHSADRSPAGSEVRPTG